MYCYQFSKKKKRKKKKKKKTISLASRLISLSFKLSLGGGGGFGCFNRKSLFKITFRPVTFMFLAHIRVPLLVLVTFRSILAHLIDKPLALDNTLCVSMEMLYSLC